MKRLLGMFCAAILFCSVVLPWDVYADYALPSHIRVGLYFGSSAKASVSVSSGAGFAIGNYDGSEFYSFTETDQTTLTVQVNGSRILVIGGDGQNVYTAENGAEGLGLSPRATGMDERVTIEGIEYRGSLDFVLSNGEMIISNVVKLDQYLYGVISREMSPTWPKEALKAQAVCSRNYAVNNLNKHSSYGFDLCNTVCCQAYSGTKFESEGSFAPVNETSNQVMTYDGELAQLYYCASMGPTTEDVENVWGNTLPYLISVDNSYEDTNNIPNGLWTGFLSCDEATTIMRNKGYEVGEVTNIKVLEYTPNGRALRMEVTGTEGSKTFEREACRTLFNTITKSQLFTVTGNGDAAKIVPDIQVTNGEQVAQVPANQMILLTGSGRATLEGDVLYATNGVYQQTYTITITQATTNTGFLFEGVGWGHSVGMSQYGAKGMAEAGYSHVRILTHYFPGTNLENAY